MTAREAIAEANAVAVRLRDILFYPPTGDPIPGPFVDSRISTLARRLSNALAAIEAELDAKERERLALIGYISTLGPHINQHPEHVEQWWRKRYGDCPVRGGVL